MMGDRTKQALARIEVAASRIEQASARLGGSDGALAARHEDLRGAVSQALQEIDALIGSAKA